MKWVNSHDGFEIMTATYKKLSYRRGTTRCATSVETVQNVAQTFTELHLKSHATGEWLSRSFKVTENGMNG